MASRHHPFTGAKSVGLLDGLLGVAGMMTLVMTDRTRFRRNQRGTAIGFPVAQFSMPSSLMEFILSLRRSEASRSSVGNWSRISGGSPAYPMLRLVVDSVLILVDIKPF